MLTTLVAVITGCGKDAPKCSDEETIGLVRQIVLGKTGGTDGLSEKEISGLIKIELPRASGYDEKIKKYSCEGKLIAGDAYQLPITYESQVDDKGQHIVSVDGISRGDLWGVYAGVSEAAKKIKSSRSPQNQPQESPPLQNAPDQQIVNSQPQITETENQTALVPSFDCTKASTTIEKAICADPLLGKLDGALAQNYKAILSANIGDGAKGDLRATQKKWVSERNQCSTSQCIADAYKKRIDEVCEYPVISGVHPICLASDDVK